MCPRESSNGQQVFSQCSIKFLYHAIKCSIFVFFLSHSRRSFFGLKPNQNFCPDRDEGQLQWWFHLKFRPIVILHSYFTPGTLFKGTESKINFGNDTTFISVRSVMDLREEAKKLLLILTAPAIVIRRITETFSVPTIRTMCCDNRSSATYDDLIKMK